MEDAKRAVECGVDGVDLVIGTSSFLREYSHGKSMEMIQKTALEVIEYVKSYVTLDRCLWSNRRLTDTTARESKCASRPKTRSDPILSISLPSTRQCKHFTRRKLWEHNH